MPTDKGVFLDTTWRLNPRISKFTSILYYEGRLMAKEELENQIINGNSPFSGGGLFLVPVNHEGNQSQSLEEVGKIKNIIGHLLSAGLTWTDRVGKTSPLE